MGSPEETTVPGCPSDIKKYTKSMKKKHWNFILALFVLFVSFVVMNCSSVSLPGCVSLSLNLKK